MNEWKANIVFKFCNCEIKLYLVVKIRILINLLEECLGKGANYWLLIVIDNILEELVDELYFKVSQIKAGIIIWVVLICQI